jgi:hypothetical protein
VPVDAPPPCRPPILRLLALLLVCAGVLAAPAAAQAADLIQLNGDPPVTFSGAGSYGLLYLDGVVRLAGDTAITASDVFIGPDAQLQACYDPATDGSNCAAGRSLSLSAAGGVAISPDIDLRGATGPSRPGGALAIHAARVSLGGGVETAGTNAPSGTITIQSAGLVVTQTLHAPGANIIVHGGGGVLVGGDVWSAGSDTATGSEPARSTSAGGVELISSGGDVSVLGSISSWGRDVASGGLLGGYGGNVTVSGSDVRISGAIDSRPGRGVDAAAGPAGPILIGARGALTVTGSIDASGDTSTSGNGSDGASVSLAAGGALSAGTINSTGGGSTGAGAGAGGAVTLTATSGLSAGAINAAGGASPQGGRHGGAVGATAATVALGAVTTDAGDATSDPANGSGEAGGTVSVKATSTAGVGKVSARGGSGRGVGGGGPGGIVSITGDRVSTGSIVTLGENLSAPGGAVTLAGQAGLLVGGSVDTAGAAGGNGYPGGAGGAIALSSPHGPLTLAGRLRSEGGTGSSGGGQGATGGNGGAIEIVAQSIAASTGVLSGGGDGGNAGVQNGPRGAGGNGGRVRVWAQLPSLILLQLVDSAGGSGDPNGADGPQQDESAPTNFAISKTQTFSFTTHAPEADGYRVFQSLAGAPSKAIASVKASGTALPVVAACVAADYWISGYSTGAGWQSDPVGPVSFTAPPSATQACSDAPQVTLGVHTLKKKLQALKRKKWRVTVRFLGDGMGTAHVVLSRKKSQLATADKPLGAARHNVSVALTIPKKLRKAGKFTVTVTGLAPVGKARSKSTLTLEVKP